MNAGSQLRVLIAMTSRPNQPRSDEADRDKETTPAGIAEELEEKAEEVGATTDPAADPAREPGSKAEGPGASTDQQRSQQP
jgi:hypothetical protein